MADPTYRIARLNAALEARHIARPDRARYLFDKLGSSVGYWSGLLGGARSFGEKVVQRIQEGLALPPGYLDDEGLSLDAMEIGQIYDQLGSDARRALRATAHALMRPDLPPAQPLLLPNPGPVPRPRKHDA